MRLPVARLLAIALLPSGVSTEGEIGPHCASWDSVASNNPTQLYSFACPSGAFLTSLYVDFNPTGGHNGVYHEGEVYLMGGACSDGTSDGSSPPTDPEGQLCSSGLIPAPCRDTGDGAGGQIGTYGCANRHQSSHVLSAPAGTNTITLSQWNWQTRLRHVGHHV